MSLYLSPQGFYRAPLLEALPWLDHRFGTALAGPPPEARTLRQVHSATVLRADSCGAAGPGGLMDVQGDALWTATPGLWIAVKTADCVPILLADPRRRAVAAVHAGWRGALAGVLTAAINALERDFGSRPADLLAAFGPAIQACCFEVGAEVATQFERVFAGLTLPELTPAERPIRLDLPEALLRQARSAGLLPAHISAGAPCTVCGPDHLHSWRRNHDPACRMHSGIAVRA